MATGLVHHSYNKPKGQAQKLVFRLHPKVARKGCASTAFLSFISFALLQSERNFFTIDN